MNDSKLELVPAEKTRGEKFEGLAFTFCKAATIILLTQKYALPVASGMAALFYVLAVLSGKADTRCWVMSAPVIAGLWMLVCIASTYLILNPSVHLLN